MRSLRKTIIDERGQWTLIGLLLGLGIMFAIVYFSLLAPSSRISPEGRLNEAAQEGEVEVQPGQTTVGAVLDKSKDPVCRNNLQQIRAYLQMEQTQGDKFPQTLDARIIGSGSMLTCPLSGQPYSYNSATGIVRCTTKGHEGF